MHVCLAPSKSASCSFVQVVQGGLRDFDGLFASATGRSALVLDGLLLPLSFVPRLHADAADRQELAGWEAR